MYKSSAPVRPITLDQLIALNDEMAALSRAGVPLDQGLLHLGRDMPGRLGQFARQLGSRLESGQPLAEALQEIPDLPPVYAAMVRAGLRSGYLAVAFEDMATLIRRVAEMRRLVSVSLIYPLFVLCLAIVLFCFTLTKCFPVLHHFYLSVAPEGRALLGLEGLASTQPYWTPPLLILALIGLMIIIPRMLFRRGLHLTWLGAVVDGFAGFFSAARFGTGEETSTGPRRARGRASIRNVIYFGRMATLTEILATLVQHRVPLPEALRLASEACGDRRVRDSSQELAGRLEAGEVIEVREALSGAPRLLALVLLDGGPPDRLASALRRLGQAYREEALWMSRWVTVSVPVSLTVFVGGAITAAYAFSVIWPFANVLFELTKATVR